MSSSRGGGAGQTCPARSSSSSVVSPIADTTTTTSLPCFLVSTMRSATRRIRSASATEDPPYFCTTSATVRPFCKRGVARGEGSAGLFPPRCRVTSQSCPTHPSTATARPGCRSTRRSPPGGAHGVRPGRRRQPANSSSHFWRRGTWARPGVMASRCGSCIGIRRAGAERPGDEHGGEAVLEGGSSLLRRGNSYAKAAGALIWCAPTHKAGRAVLRGRRAARWQIWRSRRWPAGLWHHPMAGFDVEAALQVFIPARGAAAGGGRGGLAWWDYRHMPPEIVRTRFPTAGADAAGGDGAQLVRNRPLTAGWSAR